MSKEKNKPVKILTIETSVSSQFDIEDNGIRIDDVDIFYRDIHNGKKVFSPLIKDLKYRCPSHVKIEETISIPTPNSGSTSQIKFNIGLTVCEKPQDDMFEFDVESFINDFLERVKEATSLIRDASLLNAYNPETILITDAISNATEDKSVYSKNKDAVRLANDMRNIACKGKQSILITDINNNSIELILENPRAVTTDDVEKEIEMEFYVNYVDDHNLRMDIYESGKKFNRRKTLQTMMIPITLRDTLVDSQLHYLRITGKVRTMVMRQTGKRTACALELIDILSIQESLDMN